MTKIKEFLQKHEEEFKPWLVDKEQGRVEVKILPYLQDIENGFFVEAGALDGLFMSNTKTLEDLGWHGLLIEPSSKAVERCKKSRKARVIECALVSNDFKKDMVMGDFVMDGEYGIGAWSSINRQTYGQQTEGAFRSFITPVKASTLSKVLDENGVTKVDFLSLDVEGYELEVLKGIDFEKVDIRFLLVEVNLRDYSLEDMDKLLVEKGYKNITCLSNFDSNTKGWDGSHQDYLYGK